MPSPQITRSTLFQTRTKLHQYLPRFGIIFGWFWGQFWAIWGPWEAPGTHFGTEIPFPPFWTPQKKDLGWILGSILGPLGTIFAYFLRAFFRYDFWTLPGQEFHRFWLHLGSDFWCFSTIFLKKSKPCHRCSRCSENPCEQVAKSEFFNKNLS